MNTQLLMTRPRFRAFTAEVASVNLDERTVDLIVSTETPVRMTLDEPVRTANGEISTYLEILSHEPEHVVLDMLNDGAPLLDDHDLGRQIGGIVRGSARLSGKRIVCSARLMRSQLAEERLQAMNDGIRTKFSVGYTVEEMEQVVDERGYDEDAPPVFRATRWTPFEVSSVAVGADPNARLGRSLDATVRTNAQLAKPAKTRAASPDTTEIFVMDPKTPAAADTAETARQIYALADQHKLPEEMVRTAVLSGESLDAFRARALEHVAQTRKALPVTHLDMSRSETERYRLTRAIRSITDRGYTGAGLEREASDEIARRTGQQARAGRSMFVPYDIQKRALGIAAPAPTTGAALVATDLRPQDFIEMFQDNLILPRLGARVLSGLVGNVEIPAQTGAATAHWLLENQPTPESKPSFAVRAMSPKTLSVLTPITRSMLLQSSIAIDSFVTQDLSRVAAQAMNLAAIRGVSDGLQGLLPAIGAGTSGADYNWQSVANTEAALDQAFALNETAGFLMTPAIAAILKARVKFSSTATPIYEGSNRNGRIGDYAAAAANQMPAGNLVFGDFSEMLMGEWGVLELDVDENYNFAAGTIAVRLMQSVDMIVRRPTAFIRHTGVN
jgi:HK97 family phage major capsid protein